MQYYLFEEFLRIKYISKRTGKPLAKVVIGNVISRCKKIEEMLVINLDNYCDSYEKFQKLRKKIKVLELGNEEVYVYSSRLYSYFKNDSNSMNL